MWEGAVKRAKDLYPGINYMPNQIVSKDWSDYSDQVVTRIAGGEPLDLIMVAIEGLGLLSSKKILRPLESFLDVDAKAKDALMNDIHKTLREMMQYEGKQMEFPSSWNNMVTYYNTKIFQEKGIDPPKPDWTWEDFLQTCLKVANVKGTKDDLYAYSFWGGPMFGMCAWFYNNGTSPLTPDWKDSNLLDPKVAETLQFLADLILKYKVSPNPAGWDEWGQLHSGHLAMRTCGRWCISGSVKEKFTTYDLQYHPHKSGPIRTVVGTEGWGIATMCKNTDEAWQILTLLTSKETAVELLLAGDNIPARRSAAETAEFKTFGPRNTAIFYESLEYGQTVASPPNFNVVEPICARAYASIWNGEKSVKEALEKAHVELQAEMDKLKKPA
jgi:multiple sugar transport system substrate-binding protein